MDTGAPWRPRLASRARLKFDSVANQQMLLFPEATLILNETGAAIVRLCDGARSVEQIVDGLAQEFRGVERDTLRREVDTFLESIRARGLLQ
ncbi:MAG TPA: pyrroloquinoline quinone biosynthesis peptide chaperone PqqD [Candidatus Binataceae bacterium]|nr:pyrroloquinoline quinone biosynthesis peptide chaperone PqqD [Candidatus Binataceae bacterium]